MLGSSPRRHAGAWSPASILGHAINDLISPSSSTIPGLDALRTLAILLVFSNHAYGTFVDATHERLPLGKFPLFYFGWSGVDLFFVLSGYLIGGQLWRELASTSSIKVGRFLFRRGMRIWPYYFAFLAAMLALSEHGAWTGFWPDLVFLSNYFPGQISGGWSLSTEEQFYLLAPLGLLLARRAITINRLWVPLLGLLLLLPLLRAHALATHSHVHRGDIAFMFVIYTPLHTHADGLIVGLIIAWISVVRPAMTKASRFADNVRVPVILAVTGLTLEWADKNIFDFTALALIYGGATLFALRDQSVLTALTRSRIFHIGSRLSYSMYLNHFVVLDYFMPWIFSVKSIFAPTTFGFLASYTAALSLSVAAAATKFIIIESPFLQLRDAWVQRRDRASH